MSDFVHLHCHTEFSLLDGAIKIKDLCASSVDYGMPAAAITDHGNLFGALIFYSTAREYGIKPIIGCEVYVSPGKCTQKSPVRYHLVLLAKNITGYQNLMKIVSHGWLNGFYYKPRVDKEVLERHNEGLIVLSACLQGEVQYLINRYDYKSGLKAAQEYANIFPGRFYLEMQANGIPEQMEVNEQLQKMSLETGLPLVATNDCHYLRADDVEAHDVLLCIQTNARVDAANRMRFSTNELYLKSPEEMEEAFKDCPQALENVGRIVDECNVELELGKHHFPLYDVPKGLTLEEEFIRLSREGLQERLSELPYEVEAKIYHDRLDSELEIICSKGFPAYFLIVQDFINWAKDKGIPVGPGRGSAAGCLVAYSLRITNLDPIRYSLLFERFLNVERESMPDIDVDFCYNRREEVIRYVTEKYGEDSVAQITTFGTMKAKAAVRDVGRALGIKLSLVDKIAKLIPDDLKMTIEKALNMEPDLRKMMDEDESIAKLMDISRRLEGLSRHASTHAAGIVISDKAMREYLPLYRGKKGEIVTQYDMKRVEKVGLIKFDFLGLKTLTVISDTLKLAEKGGKEVPDIDKLPLDDPDTFALLARGQTDGVFQLESSGMRNVLTDLRPSCFEDIIALLALYRPGPLESGMVTDFIHRKHGEIPVKYPHPDLEEVLKETYGVILYQEQVMKIASVLAGYSLGDGDILRRAMGKKDPAAMAKQRSKFLQGARQKGVEEETAEYIFDLVEKFAGYGFNKSHSAAYALVSYQTAYLKAHFPVEFMAALITSEVNNTDKVIAHINACREMDIKILPPCVNHSEHDFNVEDGSLRFGLSGVKNVGKGAIETIIGERKKIGPYTSLLDFCERVNMRKVTKRGVEMLIKSGAMDCMESTRSALLAGMDMVTSQAQSVAKSKCKVQLSFFSLFEGDSIKRSGLGIECEQSEKEEFEEADKLKMEKETLGLFLSGHPLLPFRQDMAWLNLDNILQCREMESGREVQLGVMVTAVKEHINKKGEKMAFCQIEDLTGQAEITMFSDLYAQAKELIARDEPLWIGGKISSFEGKGTGGNGEEGQARQLKFLGREMKPLSEVVQADDRPVSVHLPNVPENDECWDDLRQIVFKNTGRNALRLNLHLEGCACRLELGENFKVTPGQVLRKDLQAWKEKYLL
ncbi:MAG: DNA polymerase III subunit alpha [Desulfovibrionales bacterium]